METLILQSFGNACEASFGCLYKDVWALTKVGENLANRASNEAKVRRTPAAD